MLSEAQYPQRGLSTNASGYRPPWTSAVADCLSYGFVILLRDFDLQSAHVLIEILYPGCAWNWDDIITLCYQECQYQADLSYTPFCLPNVFSASTSSRFLWKLSVLNRGANLRKSPSSKSFGLRRLPVKKPRPNGEYATVATPSSLQVFSKSIWGSSMSMLNGLYSICTAST